MPSRRDFLQLASLSLPALLLPIPQRRFTTSNRELSFGLFFDEEHLSKMRVAFAGNPLFGPLRQRLAAFDRAKERQFLKSEVRYNDHLFHIARLSESAQQLAFHYAMTGD